MSKLSTLLRRIARSEPAPMGFAVAAGRTKKPEMVIVAILSHTDLDAAVAAADAGADVILLDSGDLKRDTERIKAITAAVEAPCGLHLIKPAAGASAGARELGLDYLRIEDHDTPASTLLDEEIGFVLSVEQEASDTVLRTLQSMPFDALYAGEAGVPFTIRRQLELRRISGFSGKPLLLHASETLSSEDLECLRDSGVAGVLVESGGESGSDRLSAQRQAIGQMRPRRRRRSDHQESVAVLPSVGRGGDDDDEEE